nr:MAG TPA: hypothetical protein [Caudoviricetes sp.]
MILTPSLTSVRCNETNEEKDLSYSIMKDFILTPIKLSLECLSKQLSPSALWSVGIFFCEFVLQILQSTIYLAYRLIGNVIFSDELNYATAVHIHVRLVKTVHKVELFHRKNDCIQTRHRDSITLDSVIRVTVNLFLCLLHELEQLLLCNFLCPQRLTGGLVSRLFHQSVVVAIHMRQEKHTFGSTRNTSSGFVVQSFAIHLCVCFLPSKAIVNDEMNEFTLAREKRTKVRVSCHTYFSFLNNFW